MAATTALRVQIARATEGAVGPLAKLRALGPEIESVTLYALDRRVRTMIAVTPAALERFPGVRVRRHTDAATIRRCIEALYASGPEPSPEPFDARSGVVFADRRGSRLFAAYANAAASLGQVGGQRVEFRSPESLVRAIHFIA